MDYKSLDYYLNLPWTYTIETDFDENNKHIFIVKVNELPGVCTDAPSIQEAMDLIKEAMAGAFRLYMKQGDEIPEPLKEVDFPGNIAYRTTSRRQSSLTRSPTPNDLS
jgi:predicted RNase H-like HicB family nuclease